MSIIQKVVAMSFLTAALLLPLSGCGCGFSCNGDDGAPVTRLTLGFSDAVPEDLKQVVIKVDAIIFRRLGAEDRVIDTFTIEEKGLVEADTFQVNLLDYRGVNQLIVIKDLDIESGSYSEVLIKILGNDINDSYVQEADDRLKIITVSGGELKLPGLRLSSGSQAFTVEFGLAQALQYQPLTNQYRLATNGIRIENNRTGATLSGQVDSALFNSVSPCDQKIDPKKGNRLYIYTGKVDLQRQRLADVFTAASSAPPPADALAPFAVASLENNNLTGNWDYSFGYLPPGDYTLAFACDTENDNAVEYNGLIIPLPEGQVYEFNLSEAEKAQCNVTKDATC
ncbi:MAG: DUF4382 domain-containing protein [Halioglobus sp.]|nr:DUF4382 domain-containing protein [Halioglobus sp.]